MSMKNTQIDFTRYKLNMYLIRTETFAKLFFLVSCSGLFLYAILAFYTFHSTYSSLTQITNIQDKFLGKTSRHKLIIDENSDMLYILIWAPNITNAQVQGGQEVFLNQQCSYTNCFLTLDKKYLSGVYTEFEAIVFNISSFTNGRINVPRVRKQSQKYVFHYMEPSLNHPFCQNYGDSFFNLTWTYKLDSDIVTPLFEVRDLNGNLVAPKREVNWDKHIYNVSERDMMYLKRKKKAMIWIVDKCDPQSDRLEYAKRLRSVLRKNFLDFDIFGCGMYECPNNVCYRLIKPNYYFYFVPEEHSGTDYVSKDVLKAYDNYAVPIVMGNADYKRFLPEGSYINIKTTSIDGLVALLEYIIKNPSVYYNFHRWRKMYTIKEVPVNRGFCDLCAILNQWKGERVKRNLRKWWYNGSLSESCLFEGEEYAELH